MTPADRDAHVRFLNAYYRRVKHVYDASRRFFLFGRDRTLAELLAEPWDSLIEVGPGTGRNLVKLRAARPAAQYGGVEASDEMLAMARRRCRWAALSRGFAEDVDYSRLLGAPPQRIFFSYCLSMVQDGDAALTNARRRLAPNGKVVVVDFGDFAGLPLRGAMRRFLRAFHVAAPSASLFHKHEAEVRWGPGRYYLIASMKPLAPTSEDRP